LCADNNRPGDRGDPGGSELLYVDSTSGYRSEIIICTCG